MGEVWEPCRYDERMTRCGSEEKGYRYRRDGRDWNCASRCEFCREIAVYADTHQCPDCEKRIAAIVAVRCAALESEIHAAREQARFALEFLNERDSAHALLRELAAAVKARDVADIARSLRPGDKRIEAERFAAGDALLNLLRRAEAEAGEENANG